MMKVMEELEQTMGFVKTSGTGSQHSGGSRAYMYLSDGAVT